VVFDAAGNLYIGDAVGQRILKVAPAGLTSNPLPAAVLSSGALAKNTGRLVYDGDHGLYFVNSYATGMGDVVRADTITGAMTAVAASFSPLTENGGGNLYQGHGLALDGQGYLWVAMDTNPEVAGHVGLLKMDAAGDPIKFFPYPATIGGLSTSGWWAGDVAVLGADGIRSCGGAPTPTASRTPFFIVNPMPTLSSTSTPSATATPTAVPWGGNSGDHRLFCAPSLIHGDHGRIGMDMRSLHGGPCKLRVLRNSGRTLCHLWAGVLQGGDTRHYDWDGRAEDGESLASGVYYAAFTDGDGAVFIQKVLIVR
jgi:hypothetical protein